MVGVIKFAAESEFHINGRGRVFTGLNPETCTRDQLSERYVGKIVEINGTEWLVVGVESFAVEHQPKGQFIGLLVKKPG